MSETVETSTPAGGASTLDAAAVLTRVQRLLTFTFAALVLYSFTVGTRTGSVGSGSDAAGYALTLRPSPIVYVIVGLVVSWTIPAILRKAQTAPDAARIVRRSTITIGAVVFGSMVISVLWFALIQPETLAPPAGQMYPFPFGAVEFRSDPAAP